MEQEQNGNQCENAYSCRCSKNHAAPVLLLRLDARSLGKHVTDARGAVDNMRLENRVCGWPRLTGYFVNDMRVGAIGAVRIRVRTKRQVLNRPHEFFEVAI
jgi:hypothetical protein